MSSYPGFVGFRIKTKKTYLYKIDIYKKFIDSTIKYTGKEKDRLFRIDIIEKFMVFLEKNGIEVQEGTKGEMRYTLRFYLEINEILNDYLGLKFNSEMRTSANKKHLHGGYTKCDWM
jgi:hypothetical protein